MISFKSTERPIQIDKGTVYFVPFIENFEALVGTTVLIDGQEFLVKDVQRNRCSGFYFRETPWEFRDVGLLV